MNSEIRSAFLRSPLGWLEIRATDDAVTGLEFAARGGKSAAAPLLTECKRQLEAYFSRRLFEFDLPLAASGTPFQKKVWRALREIPYGETRSYGDIARAIANPLAFRAVGGANNKNPIALIVPCHRVIGTSGDPVGYASGVNKKRWLLRHEAHR